MATITSENRQAWQNLADSFKANFPSVGKTVKIVGGRKHNGKTGIVKWHGINKFYNTRYLSEAQLHLRDMRGRDGYCVKVETEAGETFFVPAEYTEVINK